MSISQSSYQVFDQYRRIFFRRKWFVLLGFSLVLITVAIGSRFLPRVYEAHTIVIVEDEDILNPLVRGIAVTSPIDQQLRTLKYRIGSRPRVEQLVKDLSLEKGLKPDSMAYENLITKIQNNLNVNIRGKNLIEISYQGLDPQKVMKVVDTLTKSFINESQKKQGEGTESALSFIQEQLGIYKGKLEKSEAALRDFKEKHLNELPGTENVNQTRLTQATQDLVATDLELSQTKVSIDRLQEQLNKYPELQVSEVTKEESPVVSMLKSRKAQLELELTKLQADYTDKHPKVIAVKEEIANVQKRLSQESKQEVSKEVSSINPIRQSLQMQLEDAQQKMEALKLKKSQLSVAVKKYEAAVANVPKTEQIYAQLTRDVGVTSTIYNNLLNKMEEARVSRELELKEKTDRFRIVEPAQIPLRPIKPNIFKLLLLGAVLGVFTGVAFALLAEFLDRSFDSVEDLQGRLSIPVLGSITMIQKSSVHEKGMSK